MSAHFAQSNRLLRLVAACVAIGGAVACSDDTPGIGLKPQQAITAGDTVTGSGDLSELQAHRAAWLAHGIDDYRFQLQISCFCGGQITRPVVIEVRGGAITKVQDLETGNAVPDMSAYPTITKLFDGAIAERSGGGYVSVAYDRTLGIPVRLEVGTLANDAGTLYLVSSLVRL
jgi:uncharacterized protein DUF6174